MPMIWNDTNQAKLMALLIESHEIKVNYQLLAGLMGPECTAKALMHRFAKLKTMGKNAGAEAANGVDAPTPPSTPKTKTPVSRKRKAAATPATSGSNNDDEEDTPISPSEAKKRRTSTAKPRTARKATAGTTSKKGGKGGKNIKQEGEFPASAAASGDEQGGLKNENVSDEEGGEDDKNGLVDMEFNEGEENEEGEE